MTKFPAILTFLLLGTTAGITLPDAPSGLMVEFIRDPANVKINDLQPEFTWTVPPEAGIQTAYRILIASSEENLKIGRGDIWDSGKVIDSRSAEVELNGKKLLPNTRHFWKVMIWNRRNKPSEYSEFQSFITGDSNGYTTTGNRFLSDTARPEKIIKSGENNYFIDFGKDAFGTLFLKLDAQMNDTVIVHLGEKLKSVNKIDSDPGGSIRYHRVLLPVLKGKTDYVVELSPDARNTGPAAIHLPDSFGVITPFRYCELENCPIEIIPENIYRKTFNYYFNDNTSFFTCSDTILNQIWNISKYSMKATSFAGIYVDGDRERIPYEGDAYINQLGHYYTDREYSIARITNEYFIDHPTWPTEWLLHTVLLFYNDYLFTGNIESVKTHYEALKHKTLSSLAREDGLISSRNATDEIIKNLGFADSKIRIRDIVDWPPAQKDTGWKLATDEGERDGYELVEINTVVNAFYYRNLILMSELAKFLGKTGDSDFYTSEAEKVKSSFNRKLFNAGKGIYTDGETSAHSSLHANMTALAFGLVPAEHMLTVINFIKSRGMACSVYGSQYLLEGLFRAGETDYAFSLLTATHDRSWWNMIRTGSTITMEAWDMKFKPNSDWNHAWGAAPANIIPGYIWGISPAAPGYKKAFIKPQTGNLKHSKITVPTIRGLINAEFSSYGNLIEYSISIPGNMECDFFLPEYQKSNLLFNRKKLNAGTKILSLRPGNNVIKFKIE